MAISYTKLKDGNWGLKGPMAELSRGSVQVTKKSGETKAETVGQIIAGPFADGNALATIATAQGPSRVSPSRTQRGGSSNHPRTGCSCGSRDGLYQDSDCWQCKHDA
ncbi:MAG: hypothetical protein M0P73_19585 [Syntrophobacterales bacterium]|jgi:hypothetical protein|nr:hypothetical protein [Syntrophobacterales bacterium]